MTSKKSQQFTQVWDQAISDYVRRLDTAERFKREVAILDAGHSKGPWVSDDLHEWVSEPALKAIDALREAAHWGPDNLRQWVSAPALKAIVALREAENSGILAEPVTQLRTLRALWPGSKDESPLIDIVVDLAVIKKLGQLERAEVGVVPGLKKGLAESLLTESAVRQLLDERTAESVSPAAKTAFVRAVQAMVDGQSPADGGMSPAD